MAWWSRYSSDTSRRLGFPGRSFDEIAIAAMEVPGIAEAAARLGVEVPKYEADPNFPAISSSRFSWPGVSPEVYVPAEEEEAFGTLVVTALLPGETEQRRTAARAEKTVGAPRRRVERTGKGTAGAPEASYPREEIARAIELWRSRDSAPQEITQSSIARKGFSRTAVRRVVRLDALGVFSFGPRGGLRLHGIDGRFRAAPKKVSLRALERAHRLKPLTR